MLVVIKVTCKNIDVYISPGPIIIVALISLNHTKTMHNNNVKSLSCEIVFVDLPGLSNMYWVKNTIEMQKKIVTLWGLIQSTNIRKHKLLDVTNFYLFI